MGTSTVQPKNNARAGSGARTSCEQKHASQPKVKMRCFAVYPQELSNRKNLKILQQEPQAARSAQSCRIQSQEVFLIGSDSESLQMAHVAMTFFRTIRYWPILEVTDKSCPKRSSSTQYCDIWILHHLNWNEKWLVLSLVYSGQASFSIILLFAFRDRSKPNAPAWLNYEGVQVCL